MDSETRQELNSVANLLEATVLDITYLETQPRNAAWRKKSASLKQRLQGVAQQLYTTYLP